jgi:hypothetical protein
VALWLSDDPRCTPLRLTLPNSNTSTTPQKSVDHRLMSLRALQVSEKIILTFCNTGNLIEIRSGVCEMQHVAVSSYVSYLKTTLFTAQNDTRSVEDCLGHG